MKTSFPRVQLKNLIPCLTICFLSQQSPNISASFPRGVIEGYNYKAWVDSLCLVKDCIYPAYTFKALTLSLSITPKNQLTLSLSLSPLLLIVVVRDSYSYNKNCNYLSLAESWTVLSGKESVKHSYTSRHV